MKITRHPVDLQRIMTVFQWRRERLETDLERVRKAPTGLYSLLGTMEIIYLAGSVLDPDSPVVTRALKLAAQAGTALFVFQRIESPPRPFALGEGPPVIYTEPAGQSCASFPTWLQVFDLCLITRQPHLSDEVCRVPNEVFRHSDIVGAATEDYGFADLLRAVWTRERFTTNPAFARKEAEIRRRAADPRRDVPYVRGVTVPYLQALRKIEQRNEAGFATSLTEALQGHKAVWSSEENCQEFNGFVSLRLIAAAALAWDRGMRFEVESDYLPMSWVRGEHFRDKP
jgi:hypothetical protein